MSVKCSIILTSYNRTKFLLEAIQSVEQQAMKAQLELIIVDDASDVSEVHMILNGLDDILTIPYKLIKNEKNINNIAINWNKGIDIAQGEYICLLDSDNRKLPVFCEEMSKVLDEHSNLDAVACLSTFINENGNDTGQIRFPHFGQIENRPNITKQNLIDSGEMMFRKSVIDKFGYFDERLTTSEDWDFIINLVTQGNVGFINEILTQYRNHSDRRMNSKVNAGDIANKEILRTKKRGKLTFAIIIPPYIKDKKYDDSDINTNDRLTRSQIQVVNGWINGIGHIDYMNWFTLYFSNALPEKIEADYIFCIAPFRMHLEEMKQINSYGIPIITMHMEDTQAAHLNAQMDYFSDWIVTNDLGYFKFSKSMDRKSNGMFTKQQVIYTPNLLTDEDAIDTEFCPKEKDIDVLFCGYAYPERKVFIKNVIERLSENIKFTLIGDGWDKFEIDNFSVDIFPTLNAFETMKFYQRSKIILCYHRHRNHKIPSESIYRGYNEIYGNAVVMIDSQRKHSLFNGEVVFYDEIDDLVGKINYYLFNEDDAIELSKKAKERAKEFTYQYRAKKIVNYIRSHRMNMVN